MSFFKTLIRGKQEILDYSKEIEIHKDIKNLLWIKDGENKNYKSDVEEIQINNFKMTISFAEEPSLISVKLPVNFDIEGIDEGDIGYFPTYNGLTKDQRGVYWKLLNNPYRGDIDISYVFILYYGLERHLLKGNYEEAFDVILKLRDIYDNISFQNYSGDALILTALIKGRVDLIIKFIESLDREVKFNFSHNLYVFCKYKLNMTIDEKDIMRMAKDFEFTKLNYIKNNKQLFEKTLREKLVQRYNTNKIVIANFINKDSERRIKTDTVRIFANISIMNTQENISNIIESFKFKKAMYDVLYETHEEVKVLLRKSRSKSSIVNKVISNTSNDLNKKLNFDIEKERILIDEVINSKFILDKHFGLMNLHEFYYKYRDLDSNYIEKCIEICLEDLGNLYSLQEEYNKNNNTYFEGKIVAFNRLVIIYQKFNRVNDTIEVCDAAIEYYKAIGQYDKALEFEKRKAKFLK